MKGIFGGGGRHGARVLWPAGLAEMTPGERAAALKRGWWDVADEHGAARIYRDGRRVPPSELERERALA